MEKMLTTDVDFFKDHYMINPETNSPNKLINKKQGELFEEDYFNYMKCGNIMLRS